MLCSSRCWSSCAAQSRFKGVHSGAARVRGASAASRQARAASAARADGVPVFETLVMVNGSTDVTQTPEEQQEMLDVLWSLQYRTPGAICASAGPVVRSASRDGATAPRAAVYYRFSQQAQAEKFVAGPVFADAKARLIKSSTVSLSLWKVLVPNDIEALFRRGPAWETGVEALLVLQPTAAPAVAAGAKGIAAPAPAPALPMDVVVETVGRLQQTALAAGCVQVSCGADVMSLDTKLVWTGRFPSEDGAQRFLRSPVVAELARGLGGLGVEGGEAGPLTLASLALIEVGSVDQSKQRI
ncbi:hypothetical protein HYH03_009530 [Edaphochlamys debaryana]|uniref:Uncharacterized protein n=1 Tax=Edaphochlamys debaryana TaxID=47281 RepID=A0A835Y4D5_9CHLO|nr:hypothetical protein HYH03_009530 [Edaphochlamys debaryana]|eukprot:KAG2492290.1 hypothetical protein HYH03_009530 [Edaphochlamys debaryana]